MKIYPIVQLVQSPGLGEIYRLIAIVKTRAIGNKIVSKMKDQGLKAILLETDTENLK